MYTTVKINGRVIPLRQGMTAAELHLRAGLGSDRVIIVKHPDGGLQLISGRTPVPGPQVLDAPRFVYG